ncbi:MAG: DNA translocase FtsK, partial [Anaerolineae bacterium]|nr:DNA translocase FtsK [Anaerolineae bacterium]
MGTGGAWVLLVAWFLLALVLTLDISMREIAGAVTSLTGRINQQIERERPPEQISAASSRERQAPVRGMLSTPVMDEEEDEQVSHELPPDFTPIAGSGPAQPVRANARPNRGRGAQAANPAAVSQSADAAGSATAQVKTQRDPLWVMPKVEEILDPPTVESVKSNVEHERGRLIEETLASFGAPAHIVEISQGPTVTQFGVEPDFLETRNGRTRVRVSKIVSLADDLALALAAPRIRIQAPVPGRSYVGIEVPNAEISRVMMREVLESENFAKIRSTLRFALGKDVAGKPVAYDLAGMPHLLIAGTPGSGKSVCVNSILTALLLQNSPNELRMILVDPKRVELTGYNGIPHLLSPVVVDAERVIGALQWVQREMDARYHRFSQVGARNIVDYNKKNSPTLPYLLVLVDELADLMMLAPDETERSLTRLAQLARATGIHLVLATQRPSVDVVTGLIKANFPSRIAFAVASGIDSRVILDQPGAERLLGRGDMLFQAPDSPAPVRLQGVFVSDPEIQRL